MSRSIARTRGVLAFAQAGQSGAHVRGIEPAVAAHADLGKPAFHHPQHELAVRVFLRRDIGDHAAIAGVAIGVLDADRDCIEFRETAFRAGQVRSHPGQRRLRQQGIASMCTLLTGIFCC
jgi:hypothetical protein